MKKRTNIIFLIIAIAAVIYAGFMCLRERTVSMDNFIEVTSASNGDVIAAWYEKNETVIARVDNSGKIEKFISYDTVDGDKMYSIRGIASGLEDIAYLLLDVRDAATGEIQQQQLRVLDFGSMFGKQQKTFVLTDETENYNYRWIQVAGETISLIATDRYEENAIRRTYEYGSLLAGTLNIKNTRVYPLAEGEGIYLAIGNNTDLVYISDSGKIYRADEESVVEIYPARTLDTLMYPTFLAYAESGFVYFGEHESGNIIKLDLSNGDEEIVMAGGSSLVGTGSYTAGDFVKVSMSSLKVYTAVVYSSQEREYHILSASDGAVSVIDTMKYSWMETGKKFLISFVFAFLACCIVWVILELFLRGIRYGRTTMGRLVYVTIPLIVVAMTLFEVIAYSYYKDAIEENFEKQVEDEGNMLTALFGQSTFAEIEYPYDYTGEAYTYLKEQLNTRDLYSRILYYEGNELYIGVDGESPCFYPINIWMNEDAKELYESAALTGKQMIGYVEDQIGKRLVCITPVGGASGQTVYLMENGIFVSNINNYMSGYIRNFTIICVAFSIIILILLSIFFYRILLPINEIRWVMNRYVEGEKDARIQVNSEDELAGISRVFNKMADDTAVQIHNLEKMTQTYYRFMPTSIIELLKKDNLADITLQSRVAGEYVVMQAFYRKDSGMDLSRTEEMTNRFFKTLNHFAAANGLVSITDEADASSIRLICPAGVDVALNTALAIAARVDADNASEEAKGKLDIFFVVHKMEISFRICGDDGRYIPAVFATELDQILENHAFMEEIKNRVLVTEAAYSNLEHPEIYGARYIGKITAGTDTMGMYDIFDDRSAESVKRIRQTKESFDKAISLYEQGYYYEAKNLFTLVLRENRDDLVAKYYIFQCEKQQEE